MRTRTLIGLAGALLFLGLAGAPLLFSQEASPEKILGTWNLEVNVDTEYFYVSVTFSLADNKLEGKVSEQSGMFSDVPLKDIVFDGTALSFTFNSPTPPDGLERAIAMELKVVDDKTLEGTINVPDLGVAGTVKAAKQ